MLRLCYLIYTVYLQYDNIFCPNKLLYKTIIWFSLFLLVCIYIKENIFYFKQSKLYSDYNINSHMY